MANLDNTSKRRSSCQILLPWLINPPAPTGGFDLADRIHISHGYSGIPSSDIISVVTTLSLLDSVSIATSVFTQSLSHTLIIVDSVNGYVLAGVASSTLTLIDGVVQNLDLPTNPTSDLQLEDSVFGALSQIQLGLQHTLTIDDEVFGDVNPQSYSLSHSLILVDEVRRVLPTQNLSHTLTLTDQVVGSVGLSTNLVLSQSVSYAHSKGLATTLSLADSVVATSVRAFSFSHTLNLIHSVIGYNYTSILNDGLCTYAPIISYGTPIPATAPILSNNTTITLTYPFTSPSLTLTLRVPEYEDTEKDGYNRVIRESRGGDLKVFRQSIWPLSKLVNYEIIFNKNQQVLDFINFISVSVGQEIGLLDYYNRQWKGIIIPPEVNTTHASRSNRIINLEFEGELIPIE